MSPLPPQEVGQLIRKFNDHMYWMILRSDSHPFFYCDKTCVFSREIAMI